MMNHDTMVRRLPLTTKRHRSCIGRTPPVGIFLAIIIWSGCTLVQGFAVISSHHNVQWKVSKLKAPTEGRRLLPRFATVEDLTKESGEDDDDDITDFLPSYSFVNDDLSVWEQTAKLFVSSNYQESPEQLKTYVQVVTLLRVGVPAVFVAATAAFCYPALSLTLATMIDDYPAFHVIAQDSSQYIQNILTTCGLTFSILVGQTYYFMYQQQEEIYYALFEEVTVAKSLLEQVALVCQGRKGMYKSILECIDLYVQNDLLQTATEPAVLLSSRPIDDPFERVMFLTSVGEPSIIYKTVRTLRQARARRLGALQKKLPPIHMVLLYSLAAVVLTTFPVLGAGVQTIGGLGILKVQSWYLAFIVFGITMTLGVVNELRQPAGKGAYNVVIVLASMVEGLAEELEGRMSGKYSTRLPQERGPTVDADYSLVAASEKAVEKEQSEKNAERNDTPVKGEWIGKRLARRIRNL